MSGDAKMQNGPPVVRQHQEHVRTWNRMGGTVKESTETMVFTWLSRKVRQFWEGGFRRRIIYLLAHLPRHGWRQDRRTSR
jgi:hypothetical protein